MSRYDNGRRIPPGMPRSAAALLGLALISIAAPLAAAATGPATKKPPKPGPPLVVTGGVGHVRGTSGDLEGSINPASAATTYQFQYGPTVAYGSQTPSASLPAGTATIKVSQTAARLLPGYHYRLIAVNQFGPRDGRDRVYAPKSSSNALKFNIAKSKEESVVTYGTTATLAGSLTGAGNAAHQVVLQASPYPYLEAFTTIGTPVVTSATGAFAFQVPNLTKSTQYRISTLDPRPIYSKLITIRVGVRVTLKVRTTKPGLVRLYGTITPAEPGAPVAIELRKSVRPHGKSEATTRFATQASSVSRRATKSFSRFSVVLRVPTTGSYRATVKLSKGQYASGSSTTVTLKAAPPKHKAKHKTGKH